MVRKQYNYIYQINSYGCGVFAVMNAINYGLAKRGTPPTEQYDYRHIKALERGLNTTEEYGTEERDMIKFLRHYFHVSMKNKFSKKKLDKWLEDGNQAIILYPYAGKYHCHFSNVFQKTNNDDQPYIGANVWFKGSKAKRWSMSRIISKEIIKRMYRNNGSIMYLRWRND